MKLYYYTSYHVILLFVIDGLGDLDLLGDLSGLQVSMELHHTCERALTSALFLPRLEVEWVEG